MKPADEEDFGGEAHAVGGGVGEEGGEDAAPHHLSLEENDASFMSLAELRIAGIQNRAGRLRQSHIHRIIRGEIMTEFPNPPEQRYVSTAPRATR